jgi:hypothetical protein
MRLFGLTLETRYFEDYLSFLTEVLELELSSLDGSSMILDLNHTWLEIQKSQAAPTGVSSVRFELDAFEYEAMKQKISFFYYRRGPSRFILRSVSAEVTELVDPDGRTWSFHPQILSRSEQSETVSVRNF